MRLLVVWPEKNIETVKMLQTLQKQHEVLYWIGYEGSDLDAPPGCIFHSYRDAILAKPPNGIDDSQFAPPDTDILSQLLDTESVILTMMNSFALYKNADERKHLYYHLIRYWLGVIKKYQPEAIVLAYVPHYIYDYVIFALAKLLGIKTIMFLDTRIPGRTLVMDDFYIGSSRLFQELKNNQDKNWQLSDLSEDIRSYYLKTSDQNLAKLPPHIRFQKNKYSFFYRFFYSSKIAESIQDFSIFRRAVSFLVRSLKKINWQSTRVFLSYFLVLAGDNGRKEYRRVQSLPDFSRTHLKNTFGRDTSQFWAASEATTKVYPLDTPRRSDAVIARNWLYPFGLRRFFRSASLLFGKVATATISSSRLAESEKSRATRLEAILGMGSKFVYVPLNVQPECSTSPQGGVFVDQILMLETLAAALPDDWLIYVKEHPIQWLRFGAGFSSYKYPGYYKAISKIKNVFIVPVETSSYKLIDQAQAVALVSGAAGWEAVLRGKPAIVFGYPWYKDCPVILRANDVQSCRNAFEKIKSGFKINQQELINYLKSFDNATIRAFRAPSAGEGSGLSLLESMKNITDFLLSELKR